MTYMKLSDQLYNDLLEEPKRLLSPETVTTRLYSMSYDYLTDLIERIKELENQIRRKQMTEHKQPSLIIDALIYFLQNSAHYRAAHEEVDSAVPLLVQLNDVVDWQKIRQFDIDNFATDKTKMDSLFTQLEALFAKALPKLQGKTPTSKR